MKYIFLCLAAIVGLAYAKPLDEKSSPRRIIEEDVQIIKEERTQDANGFRYYMELSNGVIEKAEGHLVEVDGHDEEGRAKRVLVMVEEGEYGVRDPETGKVVMTHYVADQNGYRADGDLIPKMLNDIDIGHPSAVKPSVVKPSGVKPVRPSQVGNRPLQQVQAVESEEESEELYDDDDEDDYEKKK